MRAISILSLGTLTFKVDERMLLPVNNYQLCHAEQD